MATTILRTLKLKFEKDKNVTTYMIKILLTLVKLPKETQISKKNLIYVYWVNDNPLTRVWYRWISMFTWDNVFSVSWEVPLLRILQKKLGRYCVKMYYFDLAFEN